MGCVICARTNGERNQQLDYSKTTLTSTTATDKYKTNTKQMTLETNKIFLSTKIEQPEEQIQLSQENQNILKNFERTLTRMDEIYSEINLMNINRRTSRVSFNF